MAASSSSSSSLIAASSQRVQAAGNRSPEILLCDAPSTHEVGDEHREREQQRGQGRKDADDEQHGDARDPQRDGAAELDHAPVQGDVPGDDAREADQRGDVEDVGAEDDARADAVLVPCERRHRRRDLGRIRRERREHAEQRLGQTQSSADALERGDEQDARAQAHGGCQ